MRTAQAMSYRRLIIYAIFGSRAGFLVTSTATTGKTITATGGLFTEIEMIAEGSGKPFVAEFHFRARQHVTLPRGNAPG
jgi:hypothetical protein